MIEIVLIYIRDLLNEHFKKEFEISEKKVVLSNILKTDGSAAQDVDGKIVFFLVSLNEESTLRNISSRSAGKDGGSFADKTSPLHLNLQLLFCSNFDGNVYTEGLRYLSSLVRFFHINKIVTIDHLNNSGQNLRRLSFELSKLDYDQLSHLWSAIGGKLMPSVMYKVGMVIFDDTTVRKVTPVISSPENDSN
jgi:hypothetical protein